MFEIASKSLCKSCERVFLRCVPLSAARRHRLSFEAAFVITSDPAVGLKQNIFPNMDGRRVDNGRRSPGRMHELQRKGIIEDDFPFFKCAATATKLHTNVNENTNALLFGNDSLTTVCV